MIRVAVVVALAWGFVACGATSIRVRDKAPTERRSGTKAPPFLAPDHLGNTVSSSTATAESTVVLVFYRGAW